MTDKVRVAVNGYGVIGKRVADAVQLQPDMELVGVSDVESDYRIQAAATRGIPVYSSTDDASASMADAGIPIAGTLHHLLRTLDVVIDCTQPGSERRIWTTTGNTG